MKLVVFTDGHIGEYGEGNIDPESGLNTRLLDTLRVWDWALDLAVERGAQTVLFGGDRFKPHRPPTWMRDLADAKLNRYRDANVRVASLLGNHDMYDKTGRWHSYNGIQVWDRSNNFMVYDEPGTLDFDGVAVHFLPYGTRSFDLAPIDGHNLVLFHDAVAGLSREGTFVARTGISKDVLDREDFSLVMGGHIHLRQELDFQHVPALHIGTPLERIQDGDQGLKGALVVDIDKDIQLDFVPSPLPRILTIGKSWNGDVDEIVTFDAPIENQVVLLLVNHTGNAPAGLRKELEKRIRKMGVSAIKVRLQAQVTPALNVSASVDAKVPLGEQILAYARTVETDPVVLTHLEEIRRRAEA